MDLCCTELEMDTKQHMHQNLVKRIPGHFGSVVRVTEKSTAPKVVRPRFYNHLH